MRLTAIDDRRQLEAFLRKDAPLHAYALGDLDDFFWPRTTFFGLRGEPGLRAVFALYRGGSLPTLLALEGRDLAAATELLGLALPELPPRFYAHLSPHLVGLLAAGPFRLTPFGSHLKMALADRSRVAAARAPELPVRRLGPRDLGCVLALYQAAYEGNWFDARMLETGHYHAAFDGDEPVAVAGVHVVSARYRVAAVGNVATHPRWRGRGLATAVTAELCRDLGAVVDVIGLNVARGNAAAIRTYEKLGFARVAEYEELLAERA